MIVFDLETDGFLDTVTKVQCLNLIDRRTGERLRYTDHATYHDGAPTPRAGTVADGLERLALAPVIAGQNIIKYDLPVLEKLFGWRPSGEIFDTRVAAAVIWTNLKDVDFALLRKGTLNVETFQKKGLIGSNSLKAWGLRLGIEKGDFDPKDYGYTWETCPFLREMDDYCEQDCEVTLRWIEKIESKNYSPECLALEMQTAVILAGQERRGFAVDLAAAERLYAVLLSRRAELTAKLQESFPPWTANDGKPFVPKRNDRKRGYVAGVPVQKTKTVVFNPGSRDHIADRLKAIFGWEPAEFTDGGKPKVDETILDALPWPEAKLCSEYLMVDKRAGQVGGGDESWLKHEVNGRIHGTVNTNGAVTGRMTHAKPNIAQVPRVGTPYGAECRALFIATPGLVLVGCDAEGLELRMLAHYMAPWDGGAYARTVVSGKKEDGTDVHTVNQRLAGLNKRDGAKTFIYGLLYGAGDYKLGTIVYDDFTDEQKAKFDAKYPAGAGRDRALATLGKDRRGRIMKGLPAFAKLTERVKAAAKARGNLTGLDGRKLHIRSEHAALNTLLQSGGAVVMKKALCLLEDAAASTPLAGAHWHVANVHDEFQMETQPDLADQLGRLAADSIRLAGEHFKLNCPLSGSYSIGRNWAETH